MVTKKKIQIFTN